MNYMPIVPVGMFDILDETESKNAFILSHMWKVKEYKDYYSERTWKTCIIDNAIYEEGVCYPFEDMIEIAKCIEADRLFIVGPENLEDGMKTVQDTIECVEQFGTKGYNENVQWELMTILNGDPLVAAKQIDRFNDELCTPIPAYGIPVSATRMGYDRESIRCYLGISHLKHYVHAFGLDNLLELNNLCNSGFDSIDSSIAVTAAVRGIDLKQNLFIRRPPGTKPGSNRVPLTQTEFSPREIVGATKNITMLHQWCKDGITA